MNKNARRNFIRVAALTGITTYCLPQLETIASFKTEITKTVLKERAVILFQGDSITDGNRGRNDDPNHFMGHGYAFSIASRVGADYPEKQYKFYNRGISGNKVIDMEKRWQTETLDLKPDVLSILIGVNDSSSVVLKREPIVAVEKYDETYNKLLEQTKSAFPKILFVLCEPFILKVGRVAENWDKFHSDLIQRQTVIKKLAEKNDAVFVGFQDVFEKACEKTPADYWIWDGVHPTFAGHELMARSGLNKSKKEFHFKRNKEKCRG